MKNYTKPFMAITKFGSKNEIAAGSIFSAVGVDADDTYGTVTTFNIESFGGTSI